MVPGILFIAGAFGMGFAAGYTGTEELLFAAIGVEILGDILFFSGLVSMIKGKRGMAKAKAGYYSNDSLSRSFPEPMAPVSEINGHRRTRCFGLGLSFTL